MSTSDVYADDDDYTTTYVHDELSAGATSPTATVPRAGFFSELLNAAVGLSPSWFVRGGGTFTHDASTRPAAGSSFGTQGGNVFAFFLGGTWKPSEKLFFALEASVSPRSTTLAPTTATVTGAAGKEIDIETQIRAVASSLGAAAVARWVVVERKDHTIELGLDGSVQSLRTTQSLEKFETRDGTTVSVGQVSAFCDSAPRGCNPALRAALLAQTSTIPIYRIAASISDTLYKNTEIGVIGSYYLYGKDPDAAGYYTLSSFGRARARFGGGVDLSPVQFAVELDAAHSIGAFEPSVAFQYARYTDENGYNLSAQLQAKYGFSEAVGALVRVAAQIDRDGSGESVRTGTLTVGGRYTF